MEAVLADLASAPIGEPLRATLGLLRKVTRESVTPDDMRAVLAAGVTRSQIEDALEVGFAFNLITRLADTFCFEIGPSAAFEAGARHLLSRGYR
ncbi:MAG: hypothetical protein WKG01_30030 [Kofleriaceae bacterium]